MRRRFNIRQKKLKLNKKSFILVTIIFMGIGFSYLTSNLLIIGNTSVSGNKWSIYFTNVQVARGSVEASVVPTTISTSTTSLDYTVTFEKPGDYYEFNVDVVNDGTIDAVIDSITRVNIDSNYSSYINYSATYLDGTDIAINDILKKNETDTYKIRIEFRSDIEETDLNDQDVSLNLTFEVNYKQYTPTPSLFTKLIKKNAISDSGIDFTNVSSSTNGEGLYIKESTRNDNYPIYYYRGNVNNNNAKFAGFCWKVVRTTETGGTKLIYNGTPDSNGDCSNTTGDNTQIGTSKYIDYYVTYNGYMYGKLYEFQSTTLDMNHLYGNTFTYENGLYTLSNTQNGLDNFHHYTCFNESETCSSLYYVYWQNEANNSVIDYLTLTDGENIEDALNNMYANTTNSTIKTVIDDWFNNTFNTFFTTNNKNYNDYLEDTIWCSDRSMNTLGNSQTSINNGFIANGGNPMYDLYYSSYGRVKVGTLNLSCSNKNDSFTVVRNKNGNGALTYPVGLLTSDEVVLAGGQSYKVQNGHSNYYLYTNKNWWTMSPNLLGGFRSYEFYVRTDGVFGYSGTVNQEYGVRPSISIKPSVKVRDGGDGTSAHPYEFVVE